MNERDLVKATYCINNYNDRKVTMNSFIIVNDYDHQNKIDC